MRTSTTKLGAAIKSARKSKKLTQMELSEELGITPRYLQGIENENKTPSYGLLFRILSYLDIPADSALMKASSLQNLSSFYISFIISVIREKYRFSFPLPKL